MLIFISFAVFGLLRFAEMEMYEGVSSKTIPILVIIFFLTIGFLGLYMGINQLNFVRKLYDKYKDDPEKYKQEIVRHNKSEKA